MPLNDPSNPTQDADDLIFQSVAKAQAIRRKQEADAARNQRTAEVTGRATDYDVETGDWKLALNTGGTLRAQLNSNGQPLGRVPIQRNPDSQVSTITAPPTEANFSDLITNIDTLSRNLVGIMGLQVGEGDPNNEASAGILDVQPRYPNDLYWDEASGTLFRFDLDSEAETPAPAWVPLFQLLQGFTGNPNDQGGTPIPVYVDGAKAIRDDGTEFTGAITGGTWTGEISDFNGVFGATEDGTYTLITNSTKALKVLAVTTSGAATLTLSPQVGNTISAGGTLTGTVGSADGNPLYFTVRLETV
jgi:hypothetical protein